MDLECHSLLIERILCLMSFKNYVLAEKHIFLQALHYDIRRGPHSIGSHVRDAAAYVCWAFGRAYSNSDMRSILELLAPHLLTIACYDREVTGISYAINKCFNI